MCSVCACVSAILLSSRLGTDEGKTTPCFVNRSWPKVRGDSSLPRPTLSDRLILIEDGCCLDFLALVATAAAAAVSAAASAATGGGHAAQRFQRSVSFLEETLDRHGIRCALVSCKVGLYLLPDVAPKLCISQLQGCFQQLPIEPGNLSPPNEHVQRQGIREYPLACHLFGLPFELVAQRP